MFASERSALVDSVMSKAEAYPTSRLRKKMFSGRYLNNIKKYPSLHPVDLNALQARHQEEMVMLKNKVQRLSKSTLQLLDQLPADQEFYDLISENAEAQIRRAFTVHEFMEDMSVGEVNDALITFLSISGNPVTRKMVKSLDEQTKKSIKAALKVIHEDTSCVLHPSIVLFLIKRPDALSRVDEYLLAHGKGFQEPLDHGHFEEYLSLEVKALGAGVL